MINVVHTSSNPISGSPWELNLLLNTHSSLVTSRLIQGTSTYREKAEIFQRIFPHDLIWNESSKDCISLLQNADIIHCHNTIFPPNLKDYLQPHQKVILHLYSVDRHNLESYLPPGIQIANQIVISDQPWQKEVYKDLSTIYLPLVKNLFNNDYVKNNSVPVITYAPTNKYNQDHIYSKGYNRILKIIEGLKKQYTFVFQLLEGIPYEENLKLKAKSDIIIDDIINESAFHNTSIESACFGAIPLTNYTGDDYPFIKTTLHTLKETLSSYLKNPLLIIQDQEKIVNWRKEHYTSKILLEKYEDFYIDLLRQNKNIESQELPLEERKKKLYHILHDWLTKHNIPHFLAFGTALVAWRDNNFEIDIDFGLFYEDKWKVKELFISDPPKGIKINNLWRTEFTFRLESNEYPKADFFFFENMGSYLRSGLSIRNKLTGLTTQEKGLRFPSSCFQGFKTINFFDRNVLIPDPIETYLDANYHQWRTPDPKPLGWGGRPCADKEFREYAIIIPTFLRNNKLKLCVESFLKFYSSDWVRIYIGDQNETISEEMVNYYKDLELKGHKVIKLPYNCGLASARNLLIKETNEPYILIVDDDFECTTQTDITKFKDVLETEEHVGIVGGKLNNHSSYLGWLYHNPVLHKILKIAISEIPYEIKKTISYPYNPREHTYIYTDIVLNFFLAKREIFNDIQWDDNLLLVEHTDFFLRLKNTQWKVVYCDDVSCNHNNDNAPQEYKNFRHKVNKEIGIKRFCEKWNIGSLNDIYYIPPKHQKAEIIPPTIPAKEPIDNTQISTMSILREIHDVCIQYNLKYSLLKDSVREIVLFKSLPSMHLTIGTPNIDQLINWLLQSGFIKHSTGLQKDKYTITIEPYDKPTKNWATNSGFTVKVPFPLIEYLKHYHGNSIVKELTAYKII